jgi:hypothetical protein
MCVCPLTRPAARSLIVFDDLSLSLDKERSKENEWGLRPSTLRRKRLRCSAARCSRLRWKTPFSKAALKGFVWWRFRVCGLNKTANTLGGAVAVYFIGCHRCGLPRAFSSLHSQVSATLGANLLRKYCSVPQPLRREASHGLELRR